MSLQRLVEFSKTPRFGDLDLHRNNGVAGLSPNSDIGFLLIHDVRLPFHRECAALAQPKAFGDPSLYVSLVRKQSQRYTLSEVPTQQIVLHILDASDDHRLQILRNARRHLTRFFKSQGVARSPWGTLGIQDRSLDGKLAQSRRGYRTGWVTL